MKINVLSADESQIERLDTILLPLDFHKYV